jgi:hypothetical protein
MPYTYKSRIGSRQMWDSMTIDEYAAFEKACGTRVLKVGDTWWVEARPFFFRPLFPFSAVAPGFKNYPAKALLGGVLHPVPQDGACNSYIHIFLYDAPQQYCIDKLPIKLRQTIKKGQKYFSARRITDFDEFVEEGSRVYHSFYDRTGYFYRKERLDKEGFAAWARPLFEQKKIMVTGGYQDGRLAAVEVSYRVEDVIIEDVFFSDTESQVRKVTDFMAHTIREAAAETDARCIFRGFPSGKQSLDESKVLRGCKVLKIPASFHINPLVLFVVRIFMKESYRKFVAITTLSDTRSEKVDFSAETVTLPKSP